MGEVYRAHDRKLGRDVAIKVLPDALASDPDRIARFQREAKVLAALNHPHIAALYGMEEASGRHFLIMELVEGETLAERLRHGALPPRDALAIACQIAEAVEAAHEKGVIHRDLKPANVKITPDEQVKVLDFGLAKVIEDVGRAPRPVRRDVGEGGSGPADEVTRSPTLSMMATQAGVILGTAAYMSPEQAKGSAADHRSDIFSFGSVLYEMLTGRPPFKGDTAPEILASVLIRDPDFSALPPNLNPRVVDLLRRCLDKNPKRRWHAAGDLRVELEIVAASTERTPDTIAGSAHAAAGARRTRERIAWSAAAVAALAAIGLAVPAVMHLREAPPEMASIRATILAPEGATLDFTNGAGLPALSPDGRHIVFGARTADGRRPLLVRSLDGLTAQPLAGTESATFPFWSPDSQFVAFFAEGKLKKIDAGGGPALTLADAPNGRGGSWSRSGVIVFAPVNAPGLQRVSSAGGASSPVLAEGGGSFPWFLPDGEHFLYQEEGKEGLPIRVGSLNGGEGTVVGSGSNAMYAGGRLLFLREGTLMAQPFDPDRRVTTGEAVPIAERVQTTLNSGRVGVFSVAETGLLLYRQGGGGRRQLTWFDRTGKAAGTVGEPDDDLDGHPELSPDGRRVAVVRDVEGNQDIWLIDLVRGGFTRFTFDPAVDNNPAWSIDGTQVVFGSNRKSTGENAGNPFGLYTKPSSGGGAEQPLLESPGPFMTPFGWTPDSRAFLYSFGGSGTGIDLWAWPMQGGKPVAVAGSPFRESSAQFSPDGRWVAYNSNESGRSEIYVVPFPAGAGKWQVSTSGGLWPRWRRDGKELFFFGPDSELMAAGIITASGTKFEVAPPTPLFKASVAEMSFFETAIPAVKPQYAVSADGRFLITVPVDDGTSGSMTLVQNWMPAR